ncbi:MAG: sugar phosphate isomerase/epimerase family protein [Planctomycetota bacterium]|nr:sugar phosphate isomerase/epimerase family protein [Planctomycetota bacterium]
MASLKYCLNASTIMTTPIMRQIEVAAEAGYEAIELWHDHIDNHVSEGGSVADIRKAVDDHGLVVPTTIYLAGWFDSQGDEYRANLDECKRRMTDSAAIGAPHIIAGPPGGRADYKLGAVRYRELMELGRSIGVKPAMEFLGFVDQLNTIEDALVVMNDSEDPDATTVLDPFHIFRGGGSVESISLLAESQIAVSHFNDVPAEPPREIQHDKDRVMPGDGEFDLGRYLALLLATGYDRYLSLELFREDLWQQDPLEVARQGMEKTRQVVEA